MFIKNRKLIFLLGAALSIYTYGCSAPSASASQSGSSSGSGETAGCDVYEKCADDETGKETADFKEAYESLNGKETKSGKTYRDVTIIDATLFVEITPDELSDILESDEEAYIYVGDEQCPWCRSVIETAIDVAGEAGIKNIYYIQIWNEDGDEVFRSKYTVEDGELKKTAEGTDSYYKLLEMSDSYLDAYKVKDDEENEYETGEKRIYAPTFIHIENGKVTGLTTALSDAQESGYDELSDEILADEREMLEEFFNGK